MAVGALAVYVTRVAQEHRAHRVNAGRQMSSVHRVNQSIPALPRYQGLEVV